MIIKHTYVYKITNKQTGKFYYGYRSCNAKLPPNQDLGVRYFTSGRMKDDFKSNPSNFDQEILQVFDVREEAYKYEQFLIEQYFRDPMCENRHVDRGAQTSAKLNERIEFGQSIKHLPASKRRRAIRQDKKRAKKLAAYNRVKKNFIQYCDLETRAIVYMIP